jgi:hypothetical protein
MTWLYEKTPRVSAVMIDPVVECSPALTVTRPLTYFVNFRPVGGGLEFTDEKGAPVPAALPVFPGVTESAAVPARLYIRRAPFLESSPIMLEVQVEIVDAYNNRLLLDTRLDLPGYSSPLIAPESTSLSRWRHFLTVLFTPSGPLQWLMTVIAAGWGLWKGYTEWRKQRQREEQAKEEKEHQRRSTERKQQQDDEKRRQQQSKRIGTLDDAKTPESAFQQYCRLLSEFGEHEELRNELKSSFNPLWLPYMRRQLGQALGKDVDEAVKYLEKMQEEWQQCLDTDTMYVVRALLDLFKRQTATICEKDLEIILNGFRAVGLGATEAIVHWLKDRVQKAEFGGVEKVLFRNGSAAGRYLLLRWAAQDKDLTSLLMNWEKTSISHPLPQCESGPCVLWPSKRGDSSTIRQGLTNWGLGVEGFNPFGPEKAEHDPLLEQVFYYESLPAWNEITTLRPHLFIAPPGSGRSALIWMMRYWGGWASVGLEKVFPVFVPVYAFTSTQELEHTFHDAIAAALRCVLANNPYGLLGLKETQQYSLAEILLQSAGKLEILQHQLEEAGLSADNPDARLLYEILAIAAQRPDMKRATLWESSCFHPYGLDYTVLLVDVRFTDETMTAELLNLLFDRWLSFMLPRNIIPKVFLSAPINSAHHATDLKWDETQLMGLLHHRLVQAGIGPRENRPLLEGLIEHIADPDTELVRAAQGSPQNLIRLGNRMVQRLANPAELTARDFRALLSGE